MHPVVSSNRPIFTRERRGFSVGTVCCNTRVFCHVVPYSHPVQNWAALVTVLLGDHEEMVTACAEKVNHFSSMLEIISKYLR